MSGRRVALLGWVMVATTSASCNGEQERHARAIRDAKNALHAMARGAFAAYEREPMPRGIIADGEIAEVNTHRLCTSALPVPRDIPAGAKYQPQLTEGQDFQTGDATSGWKCLKYTITEPMKFQYDYRQGGDYKGPARGGPDPGPDGFEASAEADLDGDGKKTTLVTVVGKVNAATRTVEVSPDTFIAGEL